MGLVWFVPVACIAAVMFALYLARDVLGRDEGTPDMQEVAATIFEGAVAFLNRQYRTIGMLVVVAAIAIFAVLSLTGKSSEGLQTAIAFIIGAVSSAVAGFIGMYVAVRSNIRTASAGRRSLGEALTVALRGGAVSGFLVVSLSVLGVFVVFVMYGGLSDPGSTPFKIVGYGFGASFVALFAQLGGGIYTKAADVGADLVGKVEAGIPEDDPRNPAVIADLVGDNVGDCAGRGADLFESISAENIGAMILGVALFKVSNKPEWVIFPLVTCACGLIASMIGLLCVRPTMVKDPMRALNNGFYVAASLSVLALAVVTQVMLGSWYYFFAGLVGIILSIVFLFITQYYTSGTWLPVRNIANASLTGPATTIIQGLAVAFETPALPVIAIVVALISAYRLGAAADPQHGGVYGTAVATVGMLMTCAYVLAMDTFGPITDNAAGIVEMSGAPDEVRDVMDELDSVGNTTKALTKGYAIGSAALAAFLLFSAYMDNVTNLRRASGNFPPDYQFNVVNLANIDVFSGGLLGAMVIFLFSSLAIRAVGRAAGYMIEEVRRQFKADPGIMEGTSRPDYKRCVDISTRGALREMVLPGLLAVGAPLLVGLVLRAEAEAALLMVGTMVGIIMATVMNNGGGAWDNGKKYIEAGLLKDADGNVQAKQSFAHAAAVVGDTVGDPFKDTAGPSLHVLIKLFATLTLVLAPLFI